MFPTHSPPLFDLDFDIHVPWFLVVNLRGFPLLLDELYELSLVHLEAIILPKFLFVGEFGGALKSVRIVLQDQILHGPFQLFLFLFVALLVVHGCPSLASTGSSFLPVIWVTIVLVSLFLKCVILGLPAIQ